MLNFERIIPFAAKAAGDHPILAASYSLPNVLCRELSSEGLISGYVADRRQNAIHRDPLVAGWWIDRNAGVWFLRRSASRSIILLNGDSDGEISGRMLLEARLKGCERILLVGPDGSIVREINTSSALLRRLSPPPEERLRTASYENAFEEMYALLGNRFRLPERAFDRESVLIVSGSLQVGGAERQATYTASGMPREYQFT